MKLMWGVVFVWLLSISAWAADVTLVSAQVVTRTTRSPNTYHFSFPAAPGTASLLIANRRK